ncbi:unnamed protein product, partial [Gongylonema pulchrum]|uniref:Dual specificity protein phosphatase 14 n=1 Tax=Gongylonema pulchrum TaxID=637853 RepID=A0A183DPI9_9BILA
IEAVIAGGGNVLVHCVAGVSRSATICLAFLTKFRCSSLRQAYQLMASKRPLVRPNIGFWRQLIAFEQEVKQNVASVHLVRDKLHPDLLIPDVYEENAAEVATLINYKPDGSKEEGLCSDERRGRRNSGGKLKFQPVLDPVLECVEAAA